MGKGKLIIPRNKTKQLKLVVTENFFNKLHDIQLYGCTLFGANAAIKFRSEALNLIHKLPLLPDIHPKNRFIDSKGTKTYRNIIFRSHYIIYSVTKTEIKIITIVHQHTSPKVIARIK